MPRSRSKYMHKHKHPKTGIDANRDNLHRNAKKFEQDSLLVLSVIFLFLVIAL